MLAVDPSSKRSGGSLLGDRARIEHDPEDSGILIRSTAAGTRLGGLAPPTRAAVQALAAAFDVVVVETVGVGQSETDVEDVADTVVVVVQPGSGDTLQFLKAGIMEVPDVLVVTKADHGDSARRARSDLEAALRALGSEATPVLAVSSVPPRSGIDELSATLANHRKTIDVTTVRADARRRTALAEFTVEQGERGIRALGGRRAVMGLLAKQQPDADMATLLEMLARQAATEEGSAPLAARTRTVSLAAQTLVLVAVFASVTALAQLFGAANLGTALGIGQLAFAATLVYLLLRR